MIPAGRPVRFRPEGKTMSAHSPELPAEVVEKTGERYRMAERLLTGGAQKPEL